LAGKTNPEASIDLKELAHKYKLTGANIKNICQNVLDKKKLNLSEDDLIQGIRKELKEREK
jgi:ATP-dependent 26S proteasome regulatory subunit